MVAECQPSQKWHSCDRQYYFLIFCFPNSGQRYCSIQQSIVETETNSCSIKCLVISNNNLIRYQLQYDLIDQWWFHVFIIYYQPQNYSVPQKKTPLHWFEVQNCWNIYRFWTTFSWTKQEKWILMYISLVGIQHRFHQIYRIDWHVYFICFNLHYSALTFTRNLHPIGAKCSNPKWQDNTFLKCLVLNTAQHNCNFQFLWQVPVGLAILKAARSGQRNNHFVQILDTNLLVHLGAWASAWIAEPCDGVVISGYPLQFRPKPHLMPLSRWRNTELRPHPLDLALPSCFVPPHARDSTGLCHLPHPLAAGT